MLWEVEIKPKERDAERARVAADYALLTHRPGDGPVSATAHGFLVEGQLERGQVDQLVQRLLVDPLVEVGQARPLGDSSASAATVLLKPGVMDPVALSVVNAARDLEIPVESVRTFRRYFLPEGAGRDAALHKVLANDAIEQIVLGPLALEHITLGGSYEYRQVTVPLRELDQPGLDKLSRDGQLSLSPAEMQTIQGHFRALGRDPSDVELETIAQTWSEHCSHKTLRGRIEVDGGRVYQNLLKETIFAATEEIRGRLGKDDWCVSVFEDNAGVVRFDDRFHVCFKVETHNHPSAIEPYGGANTGLGGVIRDPLGTGLGARPICNTDVFCFAPPDTPADGLPAGVLHPKKVMQGVVAGVRDYGNRMGIPTVNGAVCFDERYLANPLVYCGTVGTIPVDRARKQVQVGDLIVVVGGRTGRDGIHGATFSSIELSHESESVSGGAVQIGNAIVEKKLLDVVLQARDLKLYHAITDCGAGGFSSAVGEMAAELGAHVNLDDAPLKYDGLSYTEIWISESQERMVLAVAPADWPRLRALCEGEDVEAACLGHFEDSGRLRLFYKNQQVADLDLHFLHEGRPKVVRKASFTRPTVAEDAVSASPRLRISVSPGSDSGSPTEILKAILGSPNVCSKEWIIRQYDHEVQGGSVIKPLVGVANDGPSDAAVITPVLGSWAGLAVGCGLNPRYGDLDPYAMAASAVDEAIRNVVAVGGDPARTALLDNFCWGNTERPEVLGSLVLAAEACRDLALAFNTPFISGKDSLYNEYRSGAQRIAIPPTLLISALARVPDVRRCVTMDLKQPGNSLYLIGTTKNELGGSHLNLVCGRQGGSVPAVDAELAPKIVRKLHEAIAAGLIRACHDLSEGGLAVALAEMAFAGGVGADVTKIGQDNSSEQDHVLLFSESNTRFVVEVEAGKAAAFEEQLSGLPVLKLGVTVREPRLRIAGRSGEWVVWAALADLKEAWQKPLRW